MNTPDYITELKPNEVIVVGTNLAGIHAGGAAKQAQESFGLRHGYAEGLCGQTYAFPTLTYSLRKLDQLQLKLSAKKLYECARNNPDLTFYLTRVGLGIAGYPEETIKNLFKVKLSNIIYPEGF